MVEINESSNQKNSILLSRNQPVALVVGAAGFLGSYIVDKLLEKNIQVVGVDDLQFGQKQNLLKASEDKNFHLIIEAPNEISLDLPRLDYLFIAECGKEGLTGVLEIFKKFKARCLLLSSIELYENNHDQLWLKCLKTTESKIAKFASEFNLNARVLRLGPVYGPRMDFRTKDPLIKLITQALSDNLQKEVSLEFSSRALYITDAVELAVKTIFAGSTSQKIFDGVNTQPIKVSEIKQVLLDPVWYENRDFTFSSLPPWPTPNLEKTVKFLNWQPKSKLVTALRETVQFFKDNEIKVPEMEEESKPLEVEKKAEWSEEKQQELQAFKQAGESKKLASWRSLGKGGRSGPNRVLPKIPWPISKISLVLVIALISYALIWPVVVLVGGMVSFQYQLEQGLTNLQKGEFEQSLINIKQATDGVTASKSVLDSLEPLRKTGIFKSEFAMGDSIVNTSLLFAQGAESSVRGMQALLQSIKAITGEQAEQPTSYFNSAQIELEAASSNLSKTEAILKNKELNKNLPAVLESSSKNLVNKLAVYNKLVSKAQALSILLPKLTAVDGKKDYLVLLQNNMELRPGGGFIGSFAKVSFEGGKLKKLEVNDIYNIDGQLSIHVEPPKEIKEDLGQKDWFLRDSNFEPDFPTSARQAEWFLAKETGGRVEGTVALDISAIEELLKAIGPLDLPDYKEQITSENLFAKSISHAEMSFFPGSQAKKSFLTALTNNVFNKIFFLPQNNWPAIISALGKSLDEGHISIYLDDPKLFSYVLSQNWAHILPRGSEENKNLDFLSLVEANLGANKANFYLDRSYNLETVIGKDGEVKHTLRVSYTNRSPSDTFPAGKYKNRMRIYLPFGSKLTKGLWGEADITKNISGFVDYGRSGYSMLLDLAPKEQKNLVLEYTVPVKLDFQDNQANYRLDIIKQAGTLNDPLSWTITYPINFKASSAQAKATGDQEQSVQTALSTNKTFEVKFKK